MAIEKITGTPFTVPHFKRFAKGIILDNGNPWIVEPFQAAFLKDVFAGYRECWLIVPEGNAKALDVATPIPTPAGWTTMGQLLPGDEVLGSDGNPTRVTLATDVMYHRPCYRVRFNDGASIIADADHLWAVEGSHDHYRPRVLNTAKLLATGVMASNGVAYRWRVRVASRKGADKPLGVGPYVLGAWLGDGATDGGCMTNVDEEVWQRIRAAGYALGSIPPSIARGDRVMSRTVLGLKVQLRQMGVLGCKHIPDEYLLASLQQRLELLRGLLDTDGTVSKAGQVTFCVTNERLARDVRRLAWSLGRPCSFREDRAMLYGRDIGPSFRLTISCDARHAVFGLSRKASRLKPNGMTTEYRRIAAIEPVESRPVSCIQVEAEDQLYLAGESFIPTHNTTLVAGLVLYHADYTPSAYIPVAASSRDQAAILYLQSAGMVDRSESLYFDGRFVCLEGYRRIKNQNTGGRIQIFASDAGTGDGVIPSFGVCDELHRHKNLDLYRTWRGKLKKRKGAQLVAISTAGEPGDDFEETRTKIREEATESKSKGCFIRAASPGIVMHEYAVPAGDNVNDMQVVKKANPLKAITPVDLKETFESPTMTLAHWKRFACNQATRTGSQAITDAEWRAMFADMQIPPGEPIWLGVDFGWKWDTTAAVPFWAPDIEHRLLGPASILVPPRDGTSLETVRFKAAITEIHKVNPIELVVADQSRAEDMCDWMRTELGCDVVDRPQANPFAVAEYNHWMIGMRNGWLWHTGDEGLKKHALNAVNKMLPGGDTRFDRPAKNRRSQKQDMRVIDALKAASMVNSAYAALYDEDEVTTFSWRPA